MATHSSVLAWRVLWMEEPGGLLSMGLHRVRHDWSDLACMHALEKEMATNSSIPAWRIPGMEEPGGLLSMELHRVGHDWSDLAEAAALLLGLCTCGRHLGSVHGPLLSKLTSYVETPLRFSVSNTIYLLMTPWYFISSLGFPLNSNLCIHLSTSHVPSDRQMSHLQTASKPNQMLLYPVQSQPVVDSILLVVESEVSLSPLSLTIIT